MTITIWKPALVPYDWDEVKLRFCPRKGIAHILHKESNEDEQKRFYEALLKSDWLAPKVYDAIIRELYSSIREFRRECEDREVAVLRFEIRVAKQLMRKNKQRPQGGVHEAAIAQVAQRAGLTVAALKKRLQRYPEEKEPLGYWED
jgi:hypothetical protein